MTRRRHSKHFFVFRFDPEPKIANQVRNDTLFVIPSEARNLFPFKDSSPSVQNDKSTQNDHQLSFRAKRGISSYQTFSFCSKRFFVSSSTHSEWQEDVIPNISSFLGLTQNLRLRIKFAMTHYSSFRAKRGISFIQRFFAPLERVPEWQTEDKTFLRR
jgi:hypothetical protein